MNRNYRRTISNKFGDEILRDPGCILLSDDESDFWEIVDKVDFRSDILVEIGTARGISTLLLLELSHRIFTFDIKEYPIKYEIWESICGSFQPKISSQIIASSEQTSHLLKGVQFDAAFIDGFHRYDSIKYDINMLKKCGNILFHDYDWRSVEQAIQELHKEEGGVLTVLNKYAHWRSA